jgi:hypothetical protein
MCKKIGIVLLEIPYNALTEIFVSQTMKAAFLEAGRQVVCQQAICQYTHLFQDLMQKCGL